MKRAFFLTTALILTMGAAHASGTHAHSHGEMMAIGMPGSAEAATRTISVTMKETEDGEMLFEPSQLEFAAGETVRFEFLNAGELEHEFVMDTSESVAEHKALMAKFPEMEHEEANAVRLQPGESGEIVWTFANAGTFEFACLIPGHYESGMHGSLAVAPAEAPAEETLSGTFTKGVVKKVDAKTGKVTIDHEELVDLGMPAMTMVFHMAEPEMLQRVSEGGEIRFVAARVNGKLTVTRLQ